MFALQAFNNGTVLLCFDHAQFVLMALGWDEGKWEKLVVNPDSRKNIQRTYKQTTRQTKLKPLFIYTLDLEISLFFLCCCDNSSGTYKNCIRN